MKYLFFIFFLFNSIQYCQTQNIQEPFQLIKFTSVIDIGNWNECFILNFEDYKPITAVELLQNIKKWGNPAPKNESLFSIFEEISLFKKYENNFYNLIKKICALDIKQDKYFFGNEVKKDTIKVFPGRLSYYNKKKAFVLTGILSQTVYNTLQLSYQERSLKIIKEYFMPIISDFYETFDNTDIEYFGMSVTFGSKDFSDKHSMKPELISIITPREICKSYINGEITDEEVIQKSIFYGSERESNGQIKKVNILN